MCGNLKGRAHILQGLRPAPRVWSRLRAAGRFASLLSKEVSSLDLHFTLKKKKSSRPEEDIEVLINVTEISAAGSKTRTIRLI